MQCLMRTSLLHSRQAATCCSHHAGEWLGSLAARTRQQLSSRRRRSSSSRVASSRSNPHTFLFTSESVTEGWVGQQHLPAQPRVRLASRHLRIACAQSVCLTEH